MWSKKNNSFLVVLNTVARREITKLRIRYYAKALIRVTLSIPHMPSLRGLSGFRYRLSKSLPLLDRS